MGGGRRSCSSCRIPPQSTPQPQHLQGWGGLNPSSEPAPSSSAVLEPAGTGAVAGTGHPPAPGWERRGWLQEGLCWENLFLQDVRILLVPHPSSRLQGAGQVRRAGGVWGPLSGQRVPVPLQPPGGDGLPGGSRGSPAFAQTLDLMKFLAAGCVLPGCVDLAVAGTLPWRGLALPGAEGTRCRESTAAYLGDKAPELLTPASRALGTCENLGDPLDMVLYLQGKELINVPLPHCSRANSACIY